MSGINLYPIFPKHNEENGKLFKRLPFGDVQFLRSMIPHHSSAILMCEEASITDPQIIDLCDQIIQSQKEEIQQMQLILERYR